MQYIFIFTVVWIAADRFSNASPIYFVVAPNVIRLNTDEVVTLTTFGIEEDVNVEVSLKNFTNKNQTFFRTTVAVSPGVPANVTIQLHVDDLADKIKETLYVSLVAQANQKAISFKQETPILVDASPGFIFIQTDKPLYTPGQTVNIRIIPLNADLFPAKWKVQIAILNPAGVTISHSASDADGPFLLEKLKIPKAPVFGNWTILAKYTNGLQTSAKIRFEVREYVLPTFTVTFRVPEEDKVILPNDKQFKAKLCAHYVYGKPVKGHVTVTYGLVWHGHVFTMGKQRNIKLNGSGEAMFQVETEALKLPVESVWFPSGGRLFLEAAVTEAASGSVEHAVDRLVVFADTAFVFKFTQSSRHFKPGLPYVLHIDAYRANGEPARDLDVLVEAHAQVKDTEIRIWVSKSVGRKMFKTAVNGRMALEFVSPPETKSLRFLVRSKQKGLSRDSQTTAYYRATPYYSPTNTFMLVKATPTTSSPSVIPKIGDFLTVTTTNTDPIDLETVTLLGVSRGKIVYQSQTRNLGGNMTSFHFPVTPWMSPGLRLLAFSVRGSAQRPEVITDSTWLDIAEQCGQEINITTSLPHRRTFFRPGDRGSLTIRGDPKMHVGLVAVDKAVYILKNHATMSRFKLFDAIRSQDHGCGRGGGRDSASIFQDAGLAVMTNAALRTEPRSKDGCAKKAVRKRSAESEKTALEMLCCQKGSEIINATLKICFDLAKVVKEGTKSLQCAREYFRCCRQKADVTDVANVTGRIARPGKTPPSSNFDIFLDESAEVNVENIPLRSNFPESWWFQDYVLGPEGTTSIDFTLPDSITTWVVQAVGVSTQHGFCVGEPHNITAFKNFFVHLDLPYSAVRLEQLEVQATVYNYLNRDIMVRLYVSSVEGMCYAGQKGGNYELAQVDVPANDATSVSFPLIPMEIGHFKIKVTAYSLWGKDAVEKDLKVEGEGIEKIHTVSIMLDPSGKRLLRENPGNMSFSIQNKIHTDERRQHVELNLDLPMEAIPQTESCTLSIIGDVLGPTVTATIEGVESMLRLPTGCGEQNLIYLAPNVFILRYLKATNQLTSAMEKKAKTYIQDGFNRQLTFRKTDGSYGTWPHTQSSTWLTAFALKTFSQAKQFILVDEHVACSAFEWLIIKQKPDGSFTEGSWILHKEMLGGINGDVTLTAFVLIALMESVCRPMTAQLALTTRLRAVEYLESRLHEVDRPLAVAMMSYALAMANSPLKHTAFEKLNQIAKSTLDGLTYWSQGSEDHFTDDMTPYWYAKKPGALAVETTAYALLAYLEMGKIKESNLITAWLIQQRESHGSFVSTQDTVMGLQALSEYNIRTYAAILDMTCDIRSEVDEEFQKSITLNQQDAFVLKSVPQVPTGGKLHLEAEGTGVGMMQVEVRFNVPEEESTCPFNITIKSESLSHLLTQFFWQGKRNTCRPCSLDCDDEREDEEEDVDIETFTFPSVVPRIGKVHDQVDNSQPNRDINKTPATSRVGGAFSKIGQLNIRRERSVAVSARILCIEVCVRYNGKQETGMSVIDVGLFTGYQPIEDDLKKLKEKNKIQHYEHSQKSVIFYMEQISHKEAECVKFRAQQKHLAENIQPAKVHVYDYYNPDEQCTRFYKPNNASGKLVNFCDNQKRICQCLEGRCSKCEKQWYGKSWTFYWNYACTNATHAITVKIIDADTNHAGFVRYLCIVQQILYQSGQQKLRVKDKVILLKRSSCRCPKLEVDKPYTLLVKDPKKFTDIEGNELYAFLLDQTILAVEFHKPREKGLEHQVKQLARVFKRTARRLQKKGCYRRNKKKKRNLKKIKTM